MTIEYPLLLFTLFAGIAAGSACLAALLEWIDVRRFAPACRLGAYIAVPAMLIALLASAVHLGRPLLFYTGLARIFGSWISMEGLFGVLFFVAAVVYAFFWLRDRAEGRLIVSIVTAALALCLVLSQGMAYAVVQPIPSWNSPITLLFYAFSAALLGLAAVAAALALTRHGELLAAFTRWTAVVLALYIGVAGLWLVNLANAANPLAGQALGLLGSSLLALTLARILVGLLVPLAVLIWLWARKQPARAGLWIVACAVLVLAGEFLARTLFYLTALHVERFM